MQNKNRLGVFSFYIDDLHFNLGVKLLNDKFGIQTRGGCSCAGTYGHYLLHISKEKSHSITDQIDHGHMEEKPGWIRMSIHPTMTNSEIDFIIDSLKELVANHQEWAKDYEYDTDSNEFQHKSYRGEEGKLIDSWFDKSQLS
jgi:selenocysteine lyase/cysteine desulfurase